ncbi:MAG: helix-turn-helix domain-containing protein [Anaerolineae bacterium]
MRDKQPLKTGQVARYCGVSRMGVLRWIRQGKLKAYTTPGGHYRIRITDFKDFLEEFDIPVDTAFFGEETRRILVVANDASTVGTVVKALSAMPEGYEIDVALDGSSAVARIAGFKPALVVLDTMVSGFDTPELAQWLKDDSARRGIPALILTTPNLQHAAKEGPDSSPSSTTMVEQAFLRREPLEIETLQSAVRRLLAV